MSKDTGGAAFPRPASEDPHLRNCDYEAQDGMTLRDYFAAKAMQSVILNIGYDIKCEPGATVAEVISHQAYSLADAMLAERAK